LNLGMYLGVPAVVIVGIRRVRLLQSTLWDGVWLYDIFSAGYIVIW
jgi:hypothetical protein